MPRETINPYVEVERPKNISSIIVSIPHGGTITPPILADNLAIPPEKLGVDWYTGDIFNFLGELGITVIENKAGRLVDVNRSSQLPAYGPVVSLTTPEGESIYRNPLSSSEIDLLTNQIYTPYHQSLNALIIEVHRHFPKVLVLDLHSFYSELLTDVIIGNGHNLTSSEDRLFLVEEAFKSVCLITKTNEPWSGGWIVKQFSGCNSIEALQIELNKRLYLNLADLKDGIVPPRIDQEKFLHTQSLLKQAFKSIKERYTKLTASKQSTTL